MAKKLISERMVLDAAKRGEKTYLIDDQTIITDAAKDRARQLGVKFESKKGDSKSQTASPSPITPKEGTKETIAIGSDHGGFALKEALKLYLDSLGYKITDLGTYNEEACDYPDFAYAVARTVSSGSAAKGIMIDSVGVASAMVANKVKGIRAACCTDEFMARSSREHNDANVLTLGGKILGVELAKAIVKTWLGASFGGGRHQKRVDKISEIERRPTA